MLGTDWRTDGWWKDRYGLKSMRGGGGGELLFIVFSCKIKVTVKSWGLFDSGK